ncbi:aspartyl-phosphate phosphatase Spo0E family protein [Paenibacillus sp. FSL P2-0536]|uniref:aspartyl-phosphate phosphatase Spo0E family protein n=1 Tax=Paenibacillus sp. FSL P2-0536 TaxID=2921629 RepID=UPI0030F81982
MDGEISAESKLDRMKIEMETLRAELNQLGLHANVLSVTKVLEVSQRLDSIIVEYLELQKRSSYR